MALLCDVVLYLAVPRHWCACSALSLPSLLPGHVLCALAVASSLAYGLAFVAFALFLCFAYLSYLCSSVCHGAGMWLLSLAWGLSLGSDLRML